MGRRNTEPATAWCCSVRRVASITCSLVVGLLTLAVADEPLAGGNSLGPQAKPGDRGAEVFETVCAGCHEGAITRAPSPAILSLMSPTAILRALRTGAMRVQAQGLSDSDKVHVAEYLSNHNVTEGTDQLSPPQCKGASAEFAFDEPPAFSGWGLKPTNTRDISAEVAGIDKSNVGHLHLKWAFGFSGATRARSHPAIAGGAIFIGSHTGSVFAIDMKTGCARWEFQAPTEVRTGLVISPWVAGDRSAQPLVYFGDLGGNIYAVNARSGTRVWQDRPEVHPNSVITAAPVLYGGRLYVPISSVEEVMTSSKYECCTFRGSLVAYEATTGKLLWRTYTTGRPTLQGVNAVGAKMFGPSGAPIWNSPAIDEKRSQLYLGTGNNYSSPASATSNAIMALDLSSGRIKWVYQALAGDAFNTGCIWEQPLQCPKEHGPDADFGAAAILATTGEGRDLVIAGQKSGIVYALDPDTGKLIWKTSVGRGGIAGGIEFGMAVRGDSVFVPINDTGDGKINEGAARPGLYALDLRTGGYLWQSPDSGETCRNLSLCSPGIYAAVTSTPDLVLTGNNDGWLRIYDADTGRVIWHYDMTQSVLTVGGGMASGGSLGGGASPIAYHGMLIVPSGHGLVNAIPGNVLLAFDTK